MSTDRDVARVVRSWLEEGVTALPDRVLDDVLDRLPATPQRRAWWPARRFPEMNTFAKIATAAAAVVILAILGARFLAPAGLNVGGPAETPTPTQQTQAPSPTATSSDSPIDTTSWTTYTSSQYGFTVGHPADWNVRPAERAWDVDTDAADWLSPAMDDFTAPAGDVRVSAWSVALDPGRPMWVDPQEQAWANVAAWAEAYCQAAGNAPCEGIIDRAVPLCLERRDCHPGLLVPFQSDVQAFFTAGTPGEDMTVLVVWRPESHPSVLTHGGSQRLLEAFLSTMCVWPADARPPFEESIPGC